MAASTSTAFPVSIPPAAGHSFSAPSNRRRHIDQASGRALEALSHAIEYLTDELIHNGGLISANNPQVEAVQLLMALNRQVYFECPIVQTFADRCRSFLRFRSASAAPSTSISSSRW